MTISEAELYAIWKERLKPIAKKIAAYEAKGGNTLLEMHCGIKEKHGSRGWIEHEPNGKFTITISCE